MAKMLRVAGLLSFVSLLSGCYEWQYLYPVGGRSLLPVATSYIKEEPGPFGTLAVSGYTTQTDNGTQAMGVKFDGSMGFTKKQLVVEGYVSGSLGQVNIVHLNSNTSLYDSLECGYRSIMAGVRGMATFSHRQRFAFGVGPDLFYYSEAGDYETFRRANGNIDSSTAALREFNRVGNNKGFGIGMHFDEQYRFNTKVGIGMQQAVVYTNLKDSGTEFPDFLQVANTIYVDVFNRNRLYVQFGLGKSTFAGVGYRFLMYGQQ